MQPGPDLDIVSTRVIPEVSVWRPHVESVRK